MPRPRSARLRGHGEISLPTVPTQDLLNARQLKEKHVEEARVDVNAFIEYCFSHYDKNKKQHLPFVQGWMHRQWQALMSVHSRLLIVAPRSHGKCLVAGTRIQAADGRLVPVDEWEGGELVALDTHRFEFVSAWSPPVQPNGVRHVYELRTKAGRSIRASGNHPFLKVDGWTPLENIVVGDRIATPMGLQSAIDQLDQVGVFWDTVAAVEPVGEAETFDLTVPGYHNFIAEGIVVHNTSQCIARALYELGKDPNHSIKIISQSDAKAVKRLAMIRSHMKDNKRLHDVFPNLKLIDASEANKHQVTVQRPSRMADPSIEALGITSSASGDRATILLADDVVDRRNSITLPKVRQQIKDAWDDWVNLLSGDGGQIWYIATLWHQAALTHDLMANPEWAVAWYEITKAMGCYAKIPDGREHKADYPLWGWDPGCSRHPSPEVESIAPEDHDPAVGPRLLPCRCGPWTTPKLRKRKRELGPRKFARGFSNKPMSEGELKIDPAWIRTYTEEPGDDWFWYISVDTAESQGQQAAWTGVVIAAVNPANGHLRVWDAFHVKMKFPGRVKLMKDLYREILPELVIIERAGGGISLAEELISTTAIPIFGMPTKTKGGHSKDERLESTTPRLAAGQISFAPELDPTYGLVGMERGDLLSELLEWGSYPTKDIADAFAHLARYCAIKHPCAWDEEADGVNAGMTIAGRPDRNDDCMTVTLIG